jgi:hypothetical protein
MYKTTILPVVPNDKTFSLTLIEVHRLRVFENRVLWRIFGSRRGEVKSGWRKMHNEELHNYIDVVKEYKMCRACSKNEENSHTYRSLATKPEGKKSLMRPRCR